MGGRPDRLNSKTVASISANLRLLMEQTDARIKDVAKRSGVSVRMIYNVLNQERACSIEIAEQLAGVFGLEGWHLIMPNLPTHLTRDDRLRRLIEHYSAASDEGRDYIDRVAEAEARYSKTG